MRFSTRSSFRWSGTHHFGSEQKSSNPTSDQDDDTSGNAENESQFGLLGLGFCVFVFVVGHWCGYSQLPMILRTKLTTA